MNRTLVPRVNGDFRISVVCSLFRGELCTVGFAEFSEQVPGFVAHHVGMIVTNNRTTCPCDFMAKLKKAVGHDARLSAVSQGIIDDLSDLCGELVIEFALRGSSSHDNSNPIIIIINQYVNIRLASSLSKAIRCCNAHRHLNEAS